jgi:hypothetical protein
MSKKKKLKIIFLQKFQNFIKNFGFFKNEVLKLNKIICLN